MKSFAKFKVVHNGYNIDWLDSVEDVNKYMEEVVNKNPGLGVKKIMDRTITCNESRKVRIVRYQYRTLYEEVFIIECE